VKNVDYDLEPSFPLPSYSASDSIYTIQVR
jgi:hypothetical protein